ncbi:UNKNOWN [Stylonychia lemnae]|uniref:Tetraspanin family protein n=1 Tax=Stylonychia lemnae TaxID=5949 RepID=A0A078AHJ1_STYLE|nr:UNKNOWN [Stylonychia lemnae]|eukprot:CDW81326.1 UNKNOWN [Stylonychia lemnae]
MVNKNCIRWLVGACGAIYMALGIALFIMGSQAQNNQFFQILHINNYAFYALIITGSIMMMSAALGCSAADTKNEFITFIVIYLILIESNSIVRLHFNVHYVIILCYVHCSYNHQKQDNIEIVDAKIYLESLKETIQHGCQSNTGLIYEMDTIYRNGDKILCSSSYASNWPEDQRQSIIHTDMATDSLDDCPFTGMTDYQQNKYMKLLQALETQFKCAGVCYSPKFFLFSNIAGLLFLVGFVALLGFGVSFAIYYVKNLPKPNQNGFQPMRIR